MIQAGLTLLWFLAAWLVVGLIHFGVWLVVVMLLAIQLVVVLPFAVRLMLNAALLAVWLVLVVLLAVEFILMLLLAFARAAKVQLGSVLHSRVLKASEDIGAACKGRQLQGSGERKGPLLLQRSKENVIMLY